MVLTDKGSVIALDGTNPKSLEDSVAIASQKAALLKFRESLDMLIEDHDKATNKMAGVNDARKRNTSKVTKIKVKKAH